MNKRKDIAKYLPIDWLWFSFYMGGVTAFTLYISIRDNIEIQSGFRNLGTYYLFIGAYLMNHIQQNTFLLLGDSIIIRKPFIPLLWDRKLHMAELASVEFEHRTGMNVFSNFDFVLHNGKHVNRIYAGSVKRVKAFLEELEKAGVKTTFAYR